MQWNFDCICMGNIAFHGCECIVGKLTLCLVFDWVGSYDSM